MEINRNNQSAENNPSGKIRRRHHQRDNCCYAENCPVCIGNESDETFLNFCGFRIFCFFWSQVRYSCILLQFPALWKSMSTPDAFRIVRPNTRRCPILWKWRAPPKTRCCCSRQALSDNVQFLFSHNHPSDFALLTQDNTGCQCKTESDWRIVFTP